MPLFSANVILQASIHPMYTIKVHRSSWSFISILFYLVIMSDQVEHMTSTYGLPSCRIGVILTDALVNTGLAWLCSSNCLIFFSVQAFTWQVSFAANPTSLPKIENALKLDEQILRQIVVKTEPFTPFPSNHTVSKRASKQLKPSTS